MGGAAEFTGRGKEGRRKMQPRKVIQLSRSLAITIPADLCQIFGIERGAILRVGELPGYGILILRDNFEGKVPVPEARVKTMRAFMDQLYADFRRKAKALSANLTWDLFERMFSSALKEKLVSLNVPEVAKRYAELGDKTDTLKELKGKIEEIEKYHQELLEGEGFVYDSQRVKRIRAINRKKANKVQEARV